MGAIKYTGREQVIKGLEEISDYFFDIYRKEKDHSPAQEYCNVVEDLIALLKEQPNIVRCKDCFYADDFDCPAPLPTGYLCQKEHGCHTGDWFCADGRRKGESK